MNLRCSTELVTIAEVSSARPSSCALGEPGDRAGRQLWETDCSRGAGPVRATWPRAASSPTSGWRPSPPSLLSLQLLQHTVVVDAGTARQLSSLQQLAASMQALVQFLPSAQRYLTAGPAPPSIPRNEVHVEDGINARLAAMEALVRESLAAQTEQAARIQRLEAQAEQQRLLSRQQADTIARLQAQSKRCGEENSSPPLKRRNTGQASCQQLALELGCGRRRRGCSSHQLIQLTSPLPSCPLLSLAVLKAPLASQRPQPPGARRR